MGVEVRVARSQAFLWGMAGFTGLLVSSFMIAATVSTPHHFKSAVVGIGFLVAITAGVAIGVRYRGIRIIVNDDGIDIRNFLRRRRCAWHELEQVRFRRSRIQWSPETGTPTTVVVSIAGTEIESTASTGLSLESLRTLRRIVANHGVVIDGVPSPEALQQSHRREMVASAIALVLIAATIALLRHDVVAAVIVLGTVVVLLVAHEAGHATAALLFRFPITSVRLGVGPLIAQLHLGPTPVEIRAVPTFGEVAVLTPDTRFLRLRVAGFALAGVTAASAVIAVVFPFAEANLRIALVVAGALQLVNLIPQRYSTPYGEWATDSLLFLRAVFGSRSGQGTQGAAEKLARQVFELAAYLRLVAGETIEPRTVVALRRIADAHPDEPAVSDTLAWALIQHGKTDEGLKFSERSLQTELPLTMRAAQLAVKGMGLAASGRMDDAHRIRAEVFAIDASCPVLGHLDDVLAAHAEATR